MFEGGRPAGWGFQAGFGGWFGVSGVGCGFGRAVFRPDAAGGKKGRGRWRVQQSYGRRRKLAGGARKRRARRPSGRQPQQEAAAVVDDPSGNPEQAPADGAAHGEPLPGVAGEMLGLPVEAAGTAQAVIRRWRRNLRREMSEAACFEVRTTGSASACRRRCSSASGGDAAAKPTTQRPGRMSRLQLYGVPPPLLLGLRLHLPHFRRAGKPPPPRGAACLEQNPPPR